MRVLLAMLILLCSNSFAQKNTRTFSVTGTINTDTGTITLVPITDKAYYTCRREIHAPVINGKFSLKDSIEYPTAYIIQLHKGAELVYLSSQIIIDPGIQTIACNIDSLRKTPTVDNSSMREYTTTYAPQFAAVDEAFGALYQLKYELNKEFNRKLPDSVTTLLNNRKDSLGHVHDRLLFDYTLKHPDSYLVLWELADLLHNSYRPAFDSVYDQFSPAIKRTRAGRLLSERLQAAKALTVGVVFPDLLLQDTAYKPALLSLSNNKNKYTLIDFWFSHCAPCIHQFPTFRKLYADYKDHGFEIIGISVDRHQYLADWKKVIKEKQLDWPQFLDENQEKAIQLSIGHYPTNFLLDQSGRIIKRDITPEELETILNQ